MFESTDGRPAQAPQDQTLTPELEHWQRRTEELQALIARLTTRLRGRDRRIARLELAISRTVVMHHVWASHLERRLERLPFTATTGADETPILEAAHERGVTVRLPHLTRTLVAIFEVMHEYWSEWEPERPPKSSTVARAIDEKLGLKGQANGEASRSSQTFAAALRPDSVNESDGRHH
ncbi:hypothetical protein WK91_19845 [Burkholderia cepacia]|uniref:hypothetical protein n=1 Tax=Burkholderia cepacia TaxID=292 RepID=UPI00075E8A52|nr:hypothetical protein [Burkholderia cepacia]KVW14650.1 hypothetical protein WK91_19845 [Burkholderia cepacia]